MLQRRVAAGIRFANSATAHQKKPEFGISLKLREISARHIRAEA